MSKVTILPLMLLMMMCTCQGALDENRVPKSGVGFFTRLGNWICLTFYRQSKMLKAFETTINNPDDQEALNTFKDKFYPDDCYDHPELIEKAITHNRSDLLMIMEQKGLGVRDTYKKHCLDRAAQKTYRLEYPLHWVSQEYGDKGVETIAVMITKLKFDQLQKDDKGRTILYVSTQSDALEMQKKLVALCGSNTPLHDVASEQPPSAYDKLFYALLSKYGFDLESRDSRGKTLDEINNEQEECYCNPLKFEGTITPKVLKKNRKECRSVHARKDEVTRYNKIKLGENLTMIKDEEVVEITSQGKEAIESEKKLSEEEAKVAQEALLRQQEEEKKAQEALLRQKFHDDNQTVIAQQVDELKKAKEELLEKTLKKLHKNDND